MIIDLEKYIVLCNPYPKFLISRYGTIKKYNIEDIKEEFKIYKLCDGFFFNVYYDYREDKWKIQGFNNIDISYQHFSEKAGDHETTFYSFLKKYYPINSLGIYNTYTLIFTNKIYNIYSKNNTIILFGIQNNKSLLSEKCEINLPSASLLNFDHSNIGFILKNSGNREDRILYLSLFHKNKKLVHNKLKKKEYNIRKIILINILKYDITPEDLNNKFNSIYNDIKIKLSRISPDMIRSIRDKKNYNQIYDILIKMK